MFPCLLSSTLILYHLVRRRIRSAYSWSASSASSAGPSTPHDWSLTARVTSSVVHKEVATVRYKGRVGVALLSVILMISTLPLRRCIVTAVDDYRRQFVFICTRRTAILACALEIDHLLLVILANSQSLHHRFRVGHCFEVTGLCWRRRVLHGAIRLSLLILCLLSFRFIARLLRWVRAIRYLHRRFRRHCDRRSATFTGSVRTADIVVLGVAQYGPFALRIIDNYRAFLIFPFTARTPASRHQRS